MAQRCDGKVVLITGGGSGIGRATALLFVRERARVVVADISAEGGEETVHLIRERGGEAVFVKADVTKTEEVAAMIERTVGTYGRLDAAFNNAEFEGQLHPTAAGRVYAAYGGVYISVAILWLWLVDAVRPTVWDVAGVVLCLAGMAVIMLGSRPD